VFGARANTFAARMKAVHEVLGACQDSLLARQALTGCPPLTCPPAPVTCCNISASHIAQGFQPVTVGSDTGWIGGGSMAESARAVEILDLVVQTDRQIWDGGGLATIRTRNDTIRAAMASGWTPHEIADELGVRPADILRWAEPAN
jgi:hypothetical protein